MNWTYNLPTKFFEYNINELKQRLNDTKGEILLIASKRVIKTCKIDVSKFNVIDESIKNPDIHLLEKTLILQKQYQHYTLLRVMF